MSDLKYKVGDRLKDNHDDSVTIEVTYIDLCNIKPYRVKYSDGSKGDIGSDFIGKHYTKIEETKMNIEENKHHLLWKGMQSLDVMKSALTREEYIGFLKGQILKYQLRLGKKDDVAKELKKIQDYTNELNKMLNEESNN